MIIYYTDSALDSFLFNRCQELLINAADGKRIISVSQKPIDFGENICVGEIGRSHMSLFKQILAGCQVADSKYVYLAEHDCVYSQEHFNFIPPNDEEFFYNLNHWFVQWGGEHEGMYSYSRRRVLSNLVCNRELLIEAVKEKIFILEHGAEIRKGQVGACEFGVIPNGKAFVNYKDIGKGCGKAKTFRTEIPNIDIRHGGNFSGGRRAKHRRYSLEPWGSFHSVMGVTPPEKWYQEATINGADMPTRRQNDTNEKRWNKFIKPFVSEGDGVITDLGCNAGFYCRKFAELGYSPVGVERDYKALRHAHYWESESPRNVRIIESDITEYDLTCSRYVLLANVHYWIEDEKLQELVAKLRAKAVRVIVIGRHKPHRDHKSLSTLSYVKELFSGWGASDVIENGKHFSICFYNPDLLELETEKIFPHQQLAGSRKFFPSYKKLVHLVRENQVFDPAETEYYDYLKWRKFKNTDKLIEKHINVIETMPYMREPITVDGETVIDGDHRLIVAFVDKQKTLIAKRGKRHG